MYCRLVRRRPFKVLHGLKERYEKYHAVSYTDDALECAAQYSNGYVLKATDVLDAAGARVKLRQTPLPEDVIEVQKRIKFIEHRMEKAIANHEFEKARFYSDEERKERDNLRSLREKYHLDQSSAAVVGREVVEEDSFASGLIGRARLARPCPTVYCQ